MVPTHVLWQELDPLFPRAWSDRLGEFFADITVHHVDGIGHFTPLEAPADFASLVDAVCRAGIRRNTHVHRAFGESGATIGRHPVT
jgi:pimeloyl-ACP methyl ester carboxylesterase